MNVLYFALIGQFSIVVKLLRIEKLDYHKDFD